MDPITIGVMAGLGGLKAIANSKAKKSAQNQRADEILYSPWSGMTPSTEIPETNAIGDIAGGALSGYALGQNMEANKILNANLKAGLGSNTNALIASQSAAATSPWVHESSLLGTAKPQNQFSLMAPAKSRTWGF